MATTPPASPVFPAGYAPQPADFNGWVQAPLGFCTAKTVLRAAQPAGGQSLTGTAYTTLQLVAAEDPFGGWSTVATGAQAAWSYLVPYDGLYEVTICASIAALNAHLEPAVQVSGNVLYELGAAAVSAANAGIVCGSVRVALVGGLDYITGRAWTSAAATTSAGVSRECSMEIVYTGLLRLHRRVLLIVRRRDRRGRMPPCEHGQQDVYRPAQQPERDHGERQIHEEEQRPGQDSPQDVARDRCDDFPLAPAGPAVTGLSSAPILPAAGELSRARPGRLERPRTARTAARPPGRAWDCRSGVS